MKHSRQDYDRIQDPENKIPAEEPVFLLRAQDENAPDTVRFWARTAERNGANTDIVEKAMVWANKMEKWQIENGSKTPDL